jgi:multicomponent Na+:H+ antiporter subunit G
MFDHEILQFVLVSVSAVLLVSGSVFSIIGGIGICRLPDFFSRMHGAGITDTLGAGLILAGLMVQAGVSLVTFKLVVILFFLLVTSPSSCHALARSALAQGLKPELDGPTSNADGNAISSAGASAAANSSATAGEPGQ